MVDETSSNASALGGPIAPGWLSRLPLSLMTTILAGILTIAGTIAGTFLQNYASLQLERAKEEHELILKMISVGDLKQAKENLQFLAESGLITDPDQAKKILATNATPVLPPPTFNPAIGKPNGAPCGVFKGMVVENGLCVFGDGAVAK
jgi:hypothetical protein